MEDLLMVFKALSEGTRLRIIKLLEAGELCVCDLVAALDMSQPKVSFHLNVMKEAGLIKDRKQGKWTHYRIEPEDMFRRMLILSVTEKIEKEMLSGDKARLNDFIDGKPGKGCIAPMQNKKRCCGE
ncbi:MAG: metalloregulator ArsR/SmtB family transcription factor [Nitrospirae bacterium]|nr:metalloregulator ArsR/SmtB family transcription factor [Nitrospirota bacterium]